MSADEPTREEIEAAARAMWNAYPDQPPGEDGGVVTESWDQAQPWDRDFVIDKARAALIAAREVRSEAGDVAERLAVKAAEVSATTAQSYSAILDALMAAAGYVPAREVRSEATIKAEALREAAAELPDVTEGVNRVGTSRWPQGERDIYSLAIEEAQAALRARADEIEGGVDD